MTYTFFNTLPDRTECIGNSLSTINIDLVALATNLSGLSAYTVESVNYLSAGVDYLSSGVSFLSSGVSFLSSGVSYLSSGVKFLSSGVGYLSSGVNFLSATVNYVSANVITDYLRQGTLYSQGNNNIIWNVDTVGRNAKITLTANCTLTNMSGLDAGDSGNLSIQIGHISGVSLTAYGPAWKFTNNLSAMNTAVSAYNLISYYYDGSAILAGMSTF